MRFYLDITRKILLYAVALCGMLSLTGARFFPSYIHLMVKREVFTKPTDPLPYSLEDESATFEAVLTGSSILVTTTADVPQAQIMVTRNLHIAHMETVSLSAGEEHEIDCTDWQAGTYTLRILHNGDIWYGEFEAE